jgi:hypothetical protein
MPWTAADADAHKKGLSPKQKRQWAHVANSALAACLKRGGKQADCEGSAIRQANSAVGSPARHAITAMQTITVQASGYPVRTEYLDGREYLVAPVVPIVQGILNDFFVSAEEIGAFVDAWNGIPIPIGHPQNDYGEYISANSPALWSQSPGRFFNAAMDGSRLTGEAWMDVEKCTAMGGMAADCLAQMRAGELIECSTAFWPHTELTPGVWNGQHYKGIHRHLRPDHLALLPEGIGACSVADGCGIRACACAGPCTCQEEESMDHDDDLGMKPGKLRQAIRTLFAFAQEPEPVPEPDEPEEEDDEDEPPEEPPGAAADSEAPVAARSAGTGPRAADAPMPLPLRQGGVMLSKRELVEKLIAHEKTSYSEGDQAWLERIEDQRVLEQMVVEADKREGAAPLTLDSMKKYFDERNSEILAAFDHKLATFAQAAEEKNERAFLQGALITHGWSEEETLSLPLGVLRKLHETVDPVSSYAGQGHPRLDRSSVDDNLPAPSPNWD